MIRMISDYRHARLQRRPEGMRCLEVEERNPSADIIHDGLLKGPADWISPFPQAPCSYNHSDKPPAEGEAVIFSGIGHLFRIACLWMCVLAGLLAAMATVDAAQTADERTYYVAIDGNDDAPGTQEQPLRSISRAVGHARAGDTVIIREGTYPEAVVLGRSGEEGRPIVIRNYPGERPVIQPGEAGKPPPGQAIRFRAREGYNRPIGWIVIEGIEVRYGHDGIKFYNGHDIIIRDCSIVDNWNQGILGTGNRILIERNVIAHNGHEPEGDRRGLLHGIYATGTAFTITNNLIHSNSAYGIQVAASDYDESLMASPEFSQAKDWLISNNTLALNRRATGIVLWQDGVENAVIQNNIFYRNNSPNGIVFYSQGGRRHTVRNNIFYPPGEIMHDPDEGTHVASDNQEVDPRFVAVDDLNFHLRPDSPAIDAGTGEGAPKTDIEGTPRPQGEAVDTGAYEFTSVD